MASTQGLALIKTALENTDKHDFVSPQVSIDSIRQREKQEMEAAQTFILEQASPTIQTLLPRGNAGGTGYTMRYDTVGSFLKPHPHMVITENPGGLGVADVEFQVRGYDTTIGFKNTGTTQKLALQSRQDQTFDCLINGKPHQWRPLGPSKSVFELTDEANKRVALFVYAEGTAQRNGTSASGKHMPFREQKIGEVHVIEDSLCETMALQQTPFSAVVIVEQERRRATSIVSGVLPPSSKAPFSGRRRSRQDGAGEG